MPFGPLAVAIGLAAASQPAPVADAPRRVESASAARSLQGLIEEAVGRNLRVAIDRTKVLEARAMLARADAQATPMIRVGGLVGGPVPEARTTVVNDLSTITEDSLANDLTFGAVGVMLRAQGDFLQPLYTFGQISEAQAAAKGLIRAAQHGVQITRASVAYDVHRAFWGYQTIRNLEASLSEGESLLEGILEKVEALLDEESEQVTENDRLRLKHTLSSLRVRRAEAAMGKDLAKTALRLLTHRPPDAPLEIAEAELEAIPDAAPALGPALAAAGDRRPELLALRALVAAQGRWAEQHSRRFFPTLFLGGFFDFAYTTSATDQTNPFIFDRFNYLDAGLGVGMRIELDVWRKLADLEQAEAQLARRAAERAAAEEAVGAEVRKVHRELEGAYDRLEQLDKAHRAARSWLTAAMLAYDIGTGDARELIDAFVARATAEGERGRTFLQIHVGLADLARVSGRIAEKE